MRSATCLQTLHMLSSFALKAARKAFFLCVINSSTSRKTKYLLHSMTMSLELVLKIFIRTLVTVNPRDLTNVRFTEHASSAYNKQGKHLSLSKCRTADLAIFPNIAFWFITQAQKTVRSSWRYRAWSWQKNWRSWRSTEYGLMEFAGVDKKARSKMGVWKMPEWTNRHGMARADNAGEIIQ